jgi:pilus assembly protein CpaC
MNSLNFRRRARLGTALAALAFSLGTVAAAGPAAAQRPAGTYRPSQQVQLSVGQGQMIRLDGNVADVWTSNPAVADVHDTNPRQINLFGKEFGEATVIATAADGSVVYGANVRVSQNLPSINDVFRVTMPDSDIKVTTVGQLAVLTGTVASPEDAAFAANLATAELNPGVDLSKEGALCKICVVNRLKTATPLQVNLKVRIAEVSRSLVRQIGVNLFTSDSTGGTKFSVNRGDIGLGGLNGGFGVQNVPGGTTLGLARKLLGLDLIGALDLAEGDGLVTTLAEPNLTALSGETASFLAGGEYPIPIAQGQGSISIEYKSYGVGLAFTPVVLADGRISMRVRPEVSELSNEGSVKMNDTVVPALVTRRAETTVELGSGQSMMIAGLLRNVNANDIEKAPFLGDLPILGALFRSTKYKRSETELVVIVTPYLVRPVSTQLALPTDGYRAPNAGEMIFGGHSYKRRPLSATTATPAVAAPASPGFKL